MKKLELKKHLYVQPETEVLNVFFQGHLLSGSVKDENDGEDISGSRLYH